MARRTNLALERQLKRERAHQQWPEQHSPDSRQLAQCEVRILTLAAECAAAESAKQKKRSRSNAFS